MRACPDAGVLCAVASFRPYRRRCRRAFCGVIDIDDDDYDAAVDDDDDDDDDDDNKQVISSERIEFHD